MSVAPDEIIRHPQSESVDNTPESVASANNNPTGGRKLTAKELRALQKAAKDVGIPKLAHGSTFGFFSAWKSAVMDWLLGYEVECEVLHPDSVRLLARHIFSPELHEELRRQGVLDSPTWAMLLSKTRQALGFDKAQLRAKLLECHQEDAETSKAFLHRFNWLKQEGGTPDTVAKDVLLNSVTVNTRAYLERKLEVLLDAEIGDDVDEAERLESIPYATLCRLLKRGPLLESYPAKASKVDLRPKGINKFMQASGTYQGILGARQVANTGDDVSSIATKVPTSASTAQGAATEVPKCDWNAYLNVADATTPLHFANDPVSMLVGLAGVLVESRNTAVGSGNAAH